MDQFAFDPGKSEQNRQQHGVDLEWAKGLWEVTHVVIPAKNVSGEDRFLILARIEEKCYAAIYAMRGEAIRLISCHRADRRLEKIYESQVHCKKEQ